jgi:hypothetical protein
MTQSASKKEAAKAVYDEEDAVADVTALVSRDMAFPTLGYIASTFYVPEDGWAATKQWHDFNSFYPEYLNQHLDETCQLMHFIGTTIFIVLLFMEPSLFHSLLPAAIAGMAVKNLTIHVEHGFIEMATMVILFLYHMHKRRKIHIGVGTLVTAYGFAWVGHFYFEHNKPATFIYPMYSLMGDMYMWKELLPKYVTAVGHAVLG